MSLIAQALLTDLSHVYPDQLYVLAVYKTYIRYHVTNPQNSRNLPYVYARDCRGFASRVAARRGKANPIKISAYICRT